MARKTTEENTREILVVLKGGKRRLVRNVPANAKITYGPVSPGQRYDENALRIYTSQQNQLAVFVGVQEFRDLSLDVLEERVTREENRASVEDSTGKQSFSTAEEAREWVAV